MGAPEDLRSIQQDERKHKESDCECDYQGSSALLPVELCKALIEMNQHRTYTAGLSPRIIGYSRIKISSKNTFFPTPDPTPLFSAFKIER